MAAFQDDDRGVVFPTRFGTPSGNANERVMLEEVDGAGGIRTRLRAHVDGSVTMLRTHDGMPRFVRAGMMATGQSNPRGFAAWVQGGNVGVRFDPYDLEVLTPEYRPVDVTYTVLPFASPYNVPSDDTTKWHDVVTFSGSTVLVNAIPMPILQMGTFAPGNGIPWVRRVHAAVGLANYGEQNMNLTEKRVFSVGREEVRASDATATLTPTSPRAEDKAMTIGQRVDPASSKAWLGQLFYSGGSWDDIGGEWGFSSAEVTMLLTPPYLLKVSSSSTVAMAVPTLASAGSSTGSMTTSITLPPTAIGMSATPSVGHYADYPTTPHGVVYFYWSGIVVKPMAGKVHANYSRNTYSIGSVSDTEGNRTYTATNVKTYDTRSEYPVVDVQFIPFTDTTPTATDMRLNAASDHLFWSLVDNGLAIDLGPMRGQYGNYCEWEDVGARPIVSRDYETQNGSFVVSFSGVETVRVTLFREYSTGGQWVATPNLNYYDQWMGVGGPVYFGDVNGIGIYSWPYVEPYYDGNVNPVSEYKRVGGVQSPEVCAEITNALNSMVNALMGQTVYQSENAEGYYSRPAPWAQGHYFSSTTTEDKTTASLTWDTKDFILYDAVNGVFISVEGSFAGSGHPATATLSVSLKVQTRYHTNVITLGEWSYTYSDLLPEKIFDEDNGLWAVPSPQIRAIFAPLYQEQGSFKGAHYVTSAEEANGALPFHGFNFVLRLQMYDSIGTINAENASQHEIHMVPCNLLEMLYAFVFSQEYGVSQYERYPVHYVARFKALQESLFSSTVRVHIRDGTVHDWLDALGHPYIDDTTTELYRT